MPNAESLAVSVADCEKECLDAVTKLISQYKNNDYALSRIHRHCLTVLPATIEQNVCDHTNREERHNSFLQRSESFITSFLDTYPQYFFFHPSSYISYDGVSYKPCSEDEISHSLITLLTDDSNLSSRKHKIKSNVLKRIKERGTSLAVPSSNTIQSVLEQLYPNVFETRNEAKYFLTIIGDAINKQQTELTYFVHHRAKEFIDYLMRGLSFLKPNTLTQLTSLFKYKFQNHSFDKARILRIQGTGDTLLYPNLNIPDVFFVAQYYSNRYTSADVFLNQTSFNSIVQHALVLQRLGGEEKLIQWFAADAMIKAEGEKVDVETVQFMWKRFCQKKKIPSAIPNGSVLNLLLTIPELSSAYEPEKKQFVGYTGSREFNPVVALFTKFWEQTISYRVDPAINDDDLDQLELDELGTLFSSWLRTKNIGSSSRNSFNPLDEDELLSCVKHFYSNKVEIEDEKFVNGVVCSLWQKEKDVCDFIEAYLDLKDDGRPTTIDAMYREYCRQMLRSKICIANKAYFERVYNHHFL